MTLRPLIAPTVALSIFTAGCAAAPRSRPVEGGPVALGTGTLTEARKYLEGRWNLESFQVYFPGRPPVTLAGSGTLTYDDFGNMRMEIRPDPASADVLRVGGIELTDGALSTNGRTAVDLQRKTITYVLEGQAQGTPPSGPLSPTRPRYWDVSGDLLTLTTKDDAGNPMSVGRWKRMP